MNKDKSLENKKKINKILTGSDLIKISKSFDRARERSMKKKRNESLADFVEVK